MKDFNLRCDRKALADVLSFIYKGHKNFDLVNVSPALRNVIITAKGNHKAVIHHECVHYRIQTEIDVDFCRGEIALPIILLERFVAGALSHKVSIVYVNGQTHAQLSGTDDYRVKIVPLPIADIPFVNDITAPPYHIPAGMLKWLLDLTVPFICKEETRYYLQGVFFMLEEDKIRAVATDGHRLATRYANVPRQPNIVLPNFILPHGTIKVIRSLLKDEEVTFYCKENAIQIDVAGWSITSQYINGTYPDWSRVVPHDDVINQKFSVPSVKFHQMALARSYIKGSELGATTLHVEEGNLILSHSDSENNMMQVNCGSGHDAMEKRGFNLRYLNEISKTFGYADITFHVDKTDAGKAVKITGSDPTDNAYIVLMPMRI